MPARKIAQGQAGLVEAYRTGPLAGFLDASPLFAVTGDADALPVAGSQALLFAPWVLQDIGDYRGALQRWFACVSVGGVLVVSVPHAFLYERQDTAPSRRRRGQRRIYSPRALIEEIEEALAPNSYRLRWLGDLDDQYDYAASLPVGQAEVAAVVERIAPPTWGLEPTVEAALAPADLFEPDHDRIGTAQTTEIRSILALKLDHLGDFVMGIEALERLRTTFPAADITLVVASWNETLARGLRVADRVVTFDGYPRNAAEEEPDIRGKAALFDALITDGYDLAIDLRVDGESRFLLRNVQAAIKAGVGLKAHYPFLDIFLPLDPHIDHYDIAWSEVLGPEHFHAQGYCVRSPYSTACRGEDAHEGEGAIIWGPYRRLPRGDYVFEPRLEIDRGRPGLVACDVALDTCRVAYETSSATAPIRLAFNSEADSRQFEFRLFAVDGEPVPDFRFYGGRLSKRGSASGLHQSEYLMLLIDLIALRCAKTGLFNEVRI